MLAHARRLAFQNRARTELPFLVLHQAAKPALKNKNIQSF